MDGTEAVPLALWLQHHTGDPGATGTDNVSGNGPRQPITRNIATNGEAVNSGDIDTPVSVGETITHFSVHDALSGGDCWWTGEWNVGRTFQSGDTIKVGDGELLLAID